MTKKAKIYSLNKSYRVLKASYQWYKKRRNQLKPTDLEQFEAQLQALDSFVLQSNREEASRLAQESEAFCGQHFKKGIPDYLNEMLVAVLIALAVATVVRQTWFELYEIPTGSMRPTFKEQDHLSVTKTAFGLNTPLSTSHLYFDPNLVQRTSVVIWSGDRIPHLDSDSTFMGIFPYTKRYIKRCMGKPGDTLYFYGGKIFGFDENGNDLKELRDNPWTNHLEHIPYTRFDGRQSIKEISQGSRALQLTFHHFNQAIGRLSLTKNELRGDVFNGKEWLKDNPLAQATPHRSIETFSDWWGIRNFAMARILTPKQMKSFNPNHATLLEEAPLYLELRHTPSLSYPAPLFHSRGTPFITGYSTYLPLHERHLKALMESMYTCRFMVNNDRAASYGSTLSSGLSSLQKIKQFLNESLGRKIFQIPMAKVDASNPIFEGVPNGLYEFYYGKGLKVGLGAITYPLSATNPLLNTTAANIQKLFNVGIDMTTYVEPHSADQLYFPNRYVYFRDGDLYSMGGVLMKKEDPILADFTKQELEKQKASTKQAPYVAFRDYGPPLTSSGELDKEFIRTFGLKIPQGHYLMLGDNHAMSQDSRYFGLIPQSNLQGAPSFILWPPGERWGVPNQKPYPLLTLPRIIVWALVGAIALIWFLIYRYRRNKPVFKKLP